MPLYKALSNKNETEGKRLKSGTGSVPSLSPMVNKNGPSGPFSIVLDPASTLPLFLCV